VIGIRRPFGPGELPGSLSIAELGAAVATGRELESLAASTVATVEVDFADRVMAGIRREPLPSPVEAARSALVHGSVPRLVAALRDAWLVALSGARPTRLRAEALALVLVAVVGLASMLSLGALGVTGGLGLLGTSPGPALPEPTATLRPSTDPSSPPSRAPSPSPPPTPTPAPPLSIEPLPTSSGDPRPTIRPATPSPSEPDDDAQRTEDPSASDDHHDT
jgi:hypothetical protein